MALTGTEAWRGGFVVDTATNQIVTTINTVGAAYKGGFLRDPDGRLVVTVQ